MLVFYIAVLYFYIHVILASPASTGSNLTQTPTDNDPEKSQKEQLLDSSFNASTPQRPESVEPFADRIKRMVSTSDPSGSTAEPLNVDTKAKSADVCMATRCDEDAIVAKVIGHMTGTFVRKEDLFANQREQEERMNLARDSAIQSALQAFQNKFGSSKASVEVRSTKDGVAADKVDIADTRDEDAQPATYRSKGRGVYHELKNKNVVGLEKHFGQPSHAPFATLTTIVPWSDVTGGYVTQFAIAGQEMRIRSEDPETNKWENWTKF